MAENESEKNKQSASDKEESSKNDRAGLAKDIDDIEHHDSDEILAVEDDKTSLIPEKSTKWYKKKVVYIPSAIVVIIGLLFLIPATRYPILGLVIKENFVVKVVDAQTGQPVTDASVSFDGKSAVTNNYGSTTLKVKVGKGKLQITKKYYASDSATAFVPLHSNSSATYKLQATGRQVPINLVNKISMAPIADATISSDGSQAKTDSQGNAFLVLPANKASDTATITAAGFNNQSVSVTITAQKVPANTFQILPSGKVYFLSNASGRVDVVKANLDGSGQSTVVPGTGSESPSGTYVLASTDWKYVALVSMRSGLYPSLYIVNTSNDSLSLIDSGSDNFNLEGWTPNDYLVYTESVATPTPGNNGNNSLKSVNAATAKVTTLDSSTGQTSQYGSAIDEDYNIVNLLADGTVLYVKSWQGDTAAFNGLQATLYTSQANNTSKKALKSFSLTTYYPYISSVAAGPSSVYYFANPMNSNSSDDFEYSNGSVQQLSGADANSANTTQQSPSIYFASPSTNSSLWASTVNGHTAVSIGKSDGTSGKQIALLDNTFTVYGWYTDNYILLSKNSNELYIIPSSGVSNSSQLVKISNYL